MLEWSNWASEWTGPGKSEVGQLEKRRWAAPSPGSESFRPGVLGCTHWAAPSSGRSSVGPGELGCTRRAASSGRGPVKLECSRGLCRPRALGQEKRWAEGVAGPNELADCEMRSLGHACGAAVNSFDRYCWCSARSACSARCCLLPQLESRRCWRFLPQSFHAGLKWSWPKLLMVVLRPLCGLSASAAAVVLLVQICRRAILCHCMPMECRNRWWVEVSSAATTSDIPPAGSSRRHRVWPSCSIYSKVLTKVSGDLLWQRLRRGRGQHRRRCSLLLRIPFLLQQAPPTVTMAGE
ncbi:hypothetical protein M9H77_08120 [Catharanthus roseus]|uniref:Uncharacterized protein n=1 Tax=Catharanthus roseus TaxID=4058 RepID=A0ACC0BWX5_CATRO|nr:hypothetical protein M9H77_08120 [Catharanthus roseus]